MTMKKKTLQHLGLGFLASALITGGFEVFARGNAPVSGMDVQSIFNNNEDKLKEQSSEISTLSQEKDSLDQKVKELNTEIESLKKENDDISEKAKKLDKENASLKMDLYGEDAVNTEENGPSSDDNSTSQTDTNDSETNNGEKVSGTFSIQEGSTSSDIAQGLQEAGFINSAQEMQELIDQWQLNEFIQANDYELTSDMSMDEILSTITNGAYYY